MDSEIRAEIDALKREIAELRMSKLQRSVRFFRRNRRLVLISLGFAAVIPAALYAFSIPNSFVAGTPIIATDMNDNFTAIANSLNAMENKSWLLISEVNVSVATTSVPITGLNGDLDLEYKIIAKLMPAVGNTYLLLRPNSDLNGSNYLQRGIYGNAVQAPVIDATNYQGMFVAFASAASDLGQSESLLLAKSGNHRILMATLFSSYPSMPTITTSSSVWLNSAANITSLEFLSSTANGIGPGTHIEIWARR